MSSTLTLKYLHSDDVLVLGRKIVDEFKLDETVDTLGRWMAHHIAKKIKEAENATDEAQVQVESECVDNILEFWAHRNQLPNGKRPFEDFEPIFRTLQNLCTENGNSRYFPELILRTNENNENDKTKQWLNKALKLDDTAKIMIRYCISNAAQEAVDKKREWVKFAESIASEDDIDIKTLCMIVKNSEAFNPKNPDDREKEKIENILKKLEEFTEMASTLSLHLRQKLDYSERID